MGWFTKLFKRSQPTGPVETDWSALVKSLVDDGIVTDKEVAECVLGALNPAQTGTSLASKAVYQAQYPPRKTWAAVKEWMYSQSGKCADCGTRLSLEVDHIVPRKEGGVDALFNHTFRCRRCNSSRRHANGRKTELSTGAALMFIMFTYRPKTYPEYKELCREYGLTVGDIRLQEAWAQAVWLKFR